MDNDLRFWDRIRHGWNAFLDKTPSTSYYSDYGPEVYYRPDRVRLTLGNEQSIIASVYNRIATDVSTVKIQHIKVDENDRYLENVKSGLNNCLNFQANIDQTGQEFIKDAVLSMFDEGVVALIPIDTTINPKVAGSYDIVTMRVCQIIGWMPGHIKVRVYNEKTGVKQDIVVPKSLAAIIENPFYSVMNEINSTFKRLITKLNLLDTIDSQSGSGKLDIIIQLPYTIKTPMRMQQAEDRRAAIETQLKDSKYGIAYADATEKITQLNRPAENNLLKQVEYLTSMLYGQLGITESVFDGTADEKTMINYWNRTVSPILSTLTTNVERKFLTKTSRTQGHRISYFRDPFTLVPVSEIAEIGDKFTRNEILTSNELRAIIGYRPDKDPKSDKLLNKNLNQPENAEPEEPKATKDTSEETAEGE